MKTLYVTLLIASACMAQNRPTGAKPVAMTPPAPIVALPVSEVAYWKLAKLTSDDEIMNLRKTLINLDRQSIVAEICATVNAKPGVDCDISADAKMVQKKAK